MRSACTKVLFAYDQLVFSLGYVELPGLYPALAPVKNLAKNLIQLEETPEPSGSIANDKTSSCMGSGFRSSWADLSVGLSLFCRSLPTAGN